MPRREEKSIGERLFYILVLFIALLTVLLIVFYQVSLSNPPQKNCRAGVCYYSEGQTMTDQEAQAIVTAQQQTTIQEAWETGYSTGRLQGFQEGYVAGYERAKQEGQQR